MSLYIRLVLYLLAAAIFLLQSTLQRRRFSRWRDVALAVYFIAVAVIPYLEFMLAAPALALAYRNWVLPFFIVAVIATATLKHLREGRGKFRSKI